jgi:hypothetical protein
MPLGNLEQMGRLEGFFLLPPGGRSLVQPVMADVTPPYGVCVTGLDAHSLA